MSLSCATVVLVLAELRTTELRGRTTSPDWEVRQSASGDSSDSYETTFIVTFERSK